ncbi:MAG: hypothetical protein JKX83_11885 [Pseudomonadales bacterium]|nr:hypothetical protein [Pseudomonadales bacterium]
MEGTTMGLVDWIYIIGGLVLLVVLFDGLRRMNTNWKQKVRLKVVSEGDAVEAEDRDGVALLRGELPNGGARVVRTEPFISGDMEADSPCSEDQDYEFIEDNNVEPEFSTSEFTQQSRQTFSASNRSDDTELHNNRRANGLDNDAVEMVGNQSDEEFEEYKIEEVQEVKSSSLSSIEAGLARSKGSSESNKGIVRPSKADDELPPKSIKATSKIKAAVQKQLDFSDALFASQSDQPPAKPQTPEAIEEIIVIHIQIPESVRSDLLVPLLKDNGMQHGDMGIFHRQDDRNIASTPLFSLANSREPGTFDMESKQGFDVTGLTLFFTLPGPDDPVVAIDEMINLADILKTELRADWLDSGRNPLNGQILEHMRQKVRDFKLQHPG